MLPSISKRPCCTEQNTANGANKQLSASLQHRVIIAALQQQIACHEHHSSTFKPRFVL
jgi:hypothetical protein